MLYTCTAAGIKYQTPKFAFLWETDRWDPLYLTIMRDIHVLIVSISKERLHAPMYIFK